TAGPNQPEHKKTDTPINEQATRDPEHHDHLTFVKARRVEHDSARTLPFFVLPSPVQQLIPF
ncbi:hypothetical protein, partial [Pseudomonas savastanoi]